MKNTFIAIAFLFTCSGYSQDTLILDNNFKREVVYSVASIMKEKYLYPRIGERMAEFLISQYEKGEYNNLSEVKPFCSRITSDMRSIDNDKHLWVFYSPEEAYEVKAYHNLVPEDEVNKINDQYYEIDRRENFGYKKVEILDGNVGYLDLEYFTNSDTTEQALKGAMQFLSNSDAIIIDLRNNGGGQGSQYLPSYFFAEGELINLGGCLCRDSSLNVESWTLSRIEGKRMPETDLYILTSSKTFSAAEGFAYSMQSLKRGVVVGESTKGGAHPVDILIVKGGILTQFPICESFNPITKTNWERVGVKPDIKTSSESALKIAHITALENIMKKSSAIDHKAELKLLIEELRED